MSESPRVRWPKPDRFVSAALLRSYFNSAEIEEQLAAGKLRRVLHQEHHPREEDPLGHEPFCTWSRIYGYLTLDGEQVGLPIVTMDEAMPLVAQ